MKRFPEQARVLVRVKAALAGSSVIIACATTGLAQAGELEDLRNQIQILMQRLDKLEAEQNELRKEQVVEKAEAEVEPVPASVVTGGSTPGSFRLPGTSTDVSISGYIKGDLIVDDGGDLGDAFIFNAIPADGTPEAEHDSHVRLHARQSRLGITTSSVLGNGQEFKTHVEGDFFGNTGNQSLTNAASFGLRHAYAEYGNLLIGQTWTNFMDLVAYPLTVDFYGPIGKSFIRQAQIRYTFDNGVSLSIENPETDGIGAGGRLRESTGGIGADELPDFTAAWRGGPGGSTGAYEAAIVIRQLGIDGTIDGVHVDESETGWGINLAGAWKWGPATLMSSVTFGDGIGRYIIVGAANDLYVDTNGKAETIDSRAFTLTGKFDWTDTSNSTLALGYFENDDPDRSNGIDNLLSVHLNYVWNPFRQTYFGVELIYGDIEYADGSAGDATRFQFAAQRYF